MPSIINSDDGVVSGTSGIKSTGGNDGILVFQSSGTETARITAAGNVGIGTNNPADELSIYAANNTPRIRFTGASSVASGFQLGLLDGLNSVISNTENGYLIFGTNNAERMRITSAGDVGINTSAPTSKLSIVTDSSTSSLTAYGISLQDTSTTSGDIIPITFTFQSTAGRARAGIGGISQTADAIQGYGGAIGFYTRAAADASNLSSADERMRIDSSGNVGIGSTTPNAKLKVALTGTSASIVNVNSFGSAGVLSLGSIANNNEQIYLGTGDSAGIGIACGIGFLRQASGWDSALVFYTNNQTAGANGVSAIQEKARINNNGQLLVGTTSASGSTSNSGSVVSGGFSTVNGTAANTTINTATTLVTLPSNYGVCLFVANLSGTGAPSTDTAVALIVVNGGSATQTDIKTGSNMVISLSGLNVLGTQKIFTGANITWNLIRII